MGGGVLGGWGVPLLALALVHPLSDEVSATPHVGAVLFSKGRTKGRRKGARQVCRLSAPCTSPRPLKNTLSTIPFTAAPLCAPSDTADSDSAPSLAGAFRREPRWRSPDPFPGGLQWPWVLLSKPALALLLMPALPHPRRARPPPGLRASQHVVRRWPPGGGAELTVLFSFERSIDRSLERRGAARFRIGSAPLTHEHM